MAIITGASRGIGKAVALRLAREGARITVAAKSETGSEILPGSIHDTVREIEEAGGEALAVRVDVRDDEQIAAMVDQTVERWGRIDFLFNNAGALGITKILETPIKRYDLMHSINTRASLLASQLVLPHMIKQQWGHILMFAPPLHTAASPGMAPYMTTKFGMTRIAISIGEEHREDNVAGNALWPMTLIESYATINNHMGDATQWRTSEIICDAVSELLSREPRDCTARQLTDEAILREAGVTNFDKYWVVKPPDKPVYIAGKDSVMR